MVLVGTAVVFVGVRGVAVYDFRTGVGRITLAFSFLSVHVAEVIGIFLGEILAHKHAFKVHHCVFQGQSRSLQEQTVLQSSPVFQVLLFSEGYLELRHAQWHVLQVGRNGVGGQLESIPLVLEVIVLLGVHGGDVLQKAGGALQGWSGRNSAQQGQLTREIGAELGGDQGQQFGFWNVGHSFLDEYLSMLDQVQGLRKRDAVDVLVATRDREWVLVQTRCGRQDHWQERFQLSLGQDVSLREHRLQGLRNGVVGLAVVQAIFEQGHFLGQNPASEVLRSAIGQSQHKMRNTVFCRVIQFRQKRIQMFLVFVGMNVAEFQLFNPFQNLRN